MRILIVDDSRAMRLILTRMLAELGHTDVVEAEHGEQALEHVADRAPELALVDWNMPVMDGLEFVRTVRGQREYDRMKVVMVTSECGPRFVYEAMKAGADEYASKPVTRAVIEGKLQRLGLA